MCAHVLCVACDACCLAVGPSMLHGKLLCVKRAVGPFEMLANCVLCPLLSGGCSTQWGEVCSALCSGGLSTQWGDDWSAR